MEIMSAKRVKGSIEMENSESENGAWVQDEQYVQENTVMYYLYVGSVDIRWYIRI